MRNKIMALSGLVLLMGAGAAYKLHAQTPPAAPGQALAERHPEIRKAMRALNNAATALKAAQHDFAGHREKALDLTNKAIEECKQALAADK